MIHYIECWNDHFAAKLCGFRGRLLGAVYRDIRHPIRRHTGLLRPRLVQCADLFVADAQHRVNARITRQYVVDMIPTEELGVKLRRGFLIACRQLEPAEIPGGMFKLITHIIPPIESLKFG